MNLNESHKTNTFKTPNNYFEDFEARLFEKLESSEKRLGSGFKVPEDYFAKVEDNILSTVQPEVKDKQPFKINYWYASAIAAIVVVAFLVFNMNPSESLTFEDVTVASIEDYLNESYLELSDAELEELLQTDTDLNVSLNIEDEILFEYLDNRIDDPTLLIE